MRSQRQVISSQHTARAVAAVLLWCAGFMPPAARAVLFYDTVSSSYNTTAPTGQYANSGWQWQGYFGGFMGTMISPTHFITAQHINVAGTTFVHDSVFSGAGTTSYNINTAANGGTGFWDIAGTDLRIYEITGGTFSSYASLYTGSTELGMEMVIFGRGGPRGADVVVDSGSGPELKGWRTAASDGTARWGLNDVSSIESTPYGQLLAADFTAVAGQNEVHLSTGDSGGAVFVLDGTEWKLAGINFAIDGAYDTNNATGDSSEFDAALFDSGGLYIGSDTGGWTAISEGTSDVPSRQYATRISAYTGNIQAITGVPEPGSAMCLMVGGVALLVRRKRLGSIL